MKFVFVLCVAVALIHHMQAFKVVKIYKGAPPPSSYDAAPLDPGALLKGVQTAVAGKLQKVQQLVGALVQQKVALKQNALNALQSSVGNVKSQLSRVAGGAPKGLIYHKAIYVGAPKAAPAPVAPESTT